MKNPSIPSNSEQRDSTRYIKRSLKRELVKLLILGNFVDRLIFHTRYGNRTECKRRQ